MCYCCCLSQLATADLANSVEYPDDHVDTLQANDHIHVEKDSEMKTQGS